MALAHVAPGIQGWLPRTDFGPIPIRFQKSHFGGIGAVIGSASYPCLFSIFDSPKKTPFVEKRLRA